MALSVFLLLSISLWTNFSFAQNGVKFLYPTQNLTFYYLDTINVTWTSRFPKPLLYTFCKNSSWNTITENINTTVPTNGSALALMTYKNSPCWFDLRPSKEAGNGANSFTFVLKSTERSRTTIGLSPTATGAITTETPEPIDTSTPDPPSSGLSEGGKIGLGVGIPLAVIAVICGVGLFVLMRRKRRSSDVRNAAASDVQPISSSGAYQGLDTKDPESPKPYESQQRSELSSESRPHELETSTQMHELHELHELPERP